MIIQWLLRVHIKPDNWHPQDISLVFIQFFQFFGCAVMPVLPIWRKPDQDKTKIQNLEDWIHTCLNYGFMLKVSQHMNWASNFISIILRFILESSLSCEKSMDTNRINNTGQVLRIREWSQYAHIWISLFNYNEKYFSGVFLECTWKNALCVI